MNFREKPNELYACLIIPRKFVSTRGLRLLFTCCPKFALLMYRLVLLAMRQAKNFCIQLFSFPRLKYIFAALQAMRLFEWFFSRKRASLIAADLY